MQRETRSSAVAYGVVVAMLLTVALFLVACGTKGESTTTSSSESATETTSPDEPVLLAMSELARLTPAASQSDVLSAAGSIQEFGSDLYRYLAAEAGEGNLIFSPSSIVAALAMTYAGAGGITAEEMAATLHFVLQGDELHQAFNSLDTTLESRSWHEATPDGKEEGVLIKAANSLWGQKDTVFERLFLDTLAGNYGAGIRLVDYRTAAEEARQAINSWVAEETNGKIPELIPQGTLDSMTRLVLVNAIYLDATWLSQFDPEDTFDGSFTTSAGVTVTTPMMRQTYAYPYAKAVDWQAIELPYAGGQVGMLLVVPDEGRFKEVEDQLADGLIEEAAAALSPSGEVNLTMPKFEFRTQASLAGALAALGMESAFSRSTADFSGMTVEEQLYISDVIHEAYIAVDEEGTEAAAATAVVMRATGIALEQLTLTIDRPFLFALRDRETGTILFLGRVTDPTA